jgi:hypothetical protein
MPDRSCAGSLANSRRVCTTTSPDHESLCNLMLGYQQSTGWRHINDVQFHEYHKFSGGVQSKSDWLEWQMIVDCLPMCSVANLTSEVDADHSLQPEAHQEPVPKVRRFKERDLECLCYPTHSESSPDVRP